MTTMNSTLKEFRGKTFANMKSIEVCIHSSEEIKNLSAIKIQTPLVLNALGHPLSGGLYDPAMGPMNEDSGHCTTCNLSVFQCPGHMGYIELPLPVVNPLFYAPVGSLLRNTCFICHRLQLSPQFKYLVIGQLKLLEKGYITSAKNAEMLYRDVEAMDSYSTEVETRFKGLMDDYVKEEMERMKGLGETDVWLVEAMRNEVVAKAMKEFSNRKKCMYCLGQLVKLTAYKTRMIASKRNEVEEEDKDKIEENSVIEGVQKVMINGKEVNKKLKAKKKPSTTGTITTYTLSPEASRDELRKMCAVEKEYVQLLFPVLQNTSLECPIDLFFLEVIPVTPPNARPPNMMKGQIMEHLQTTTYKKIVQDALVLKNVMVVVQEGSTDTLPPEGKLLYQSVAGKTFIEKLHYAWEALQYSVDALMDNTLHPGISQGEGLKQVIEKKDGLIRMHVMGKRVNYASRSVITPDPNLNVDEVGLPEAFAKKLTFPVPVTPWNVNELRTLVTNGPQVHPGACMIQNNDGSVTKIPERDAAQRKALANMLLMPDEKLSKFSQGVKIVHRHLVNGDILLMNRQPTLHKPSIMAHKARILKGEKTLRMHYANCKSYNADFDGDEMNAHCPQSELGRSEAYNLVDVCNQYLVPKDGTPLSGLIQDHMVSGVRLSLRGRFFTKEDYIQLVYQSVAHTKGDIILLPPAIVKPATLWSGKQVISTLLINIIPRDQPRINLTASAKIAANAWIREEPRPWRGGGSPLQRNAMSEAEVVIRQGELLCGALDKTHYGATAYGLVHCVYELYGGKCANSLLTALGKLFTAFLQFMEGFTMGVEDILVLQSADKERADIIKECRSMGNKAAAAALGVPPDTKNLAPLLFDAYTRPNFRGEIDTQFKSILNTYTDKINKTCLSGGLLQKFPDNNLQLMVMSGAKGSTVNTMQISCLLGQIELEGRRPPLMVSGRSLPSFAPFDCEPRAGGFVDGRFATGIQPQEFFFHCMAGREGLIDTAVKTSRSGYLQRCLVKHLEGLSVHYDTTVRDSDGSVIQFAYGEDGMDVTKMPFLKPEHMHFIYENRHVIANNENISALKEATDRDTIKKKKKKWNSWVKNFGGTNKLRVSPFLEFSRRAGKQMDEDHPNREWKISKKSGRSEKARVLVKAWNKLVAENQTEELKNLQTKCPEPLSSAYPPSVHFGAIPERLENVLEDYLTNGKGQHLGTKEKKKFREIVYYKVLSATCHPGEPVGVLAAQSVGEPSTQMTLNTFHFAGRGEMNVTLGIPRLKEILMTASKNISTPSMEIPFRSGVSSKIAEKLKTKLTKLKLSDVLEFIKVTESLALEPERVNVYKLEMHFLPHDLYKNEFHTSPRRILAHIEKKFLQELVVEIKRLMKIKITVMSDEVISAVEAKEEAENVDDPETKVAKKTSGEHYISSDEEEEGDEDDATAAKLRQKRLDGDHVDESDSEGEESGAENEGAGKEMDEESENGEKAGLDEEELKATDARKRRNYLINKYSCVQDYKYDKESEEWCVVEIGLPITLRKINLAAVLKNLASKSVVACVPGINRAFVVNDKQKGLILKTDGLNMSEMVKYEDVLDIDRIYSNDIHALGATYGIEAAGRVIVKEIREVFKVYGIEVDPRHLMLISDYLTSDGKFKGMNRKGLENNPSFLQKMSFESSLTFLKAAVWGGKKEFLQSPSSRIFIGHPCKSGTGAFEVLQRLSAVESA